MNPSKRYSGLSVAARGAIALAAVASFLAYQSTSSPARADSAACPAPSAPTLAAGVYSIDDSAHLQWVKATTAAWDDSFIQTAHIDMGGCVWSGGIAEGANPFTGIYNGGDFEIRDLDVEADNGGYVGLFERLDGTIKNLGFTGNVNGVGSANAVWVGGLVGKASSGVILDSYTTGSVTTSYSDAQYVGGLVGWMEGGTIRGSHSTGDVTSQYSSTDTWGTGGLVGNAEKGTQPGGAVIEASHATGNVTATTQAGGLVGRTDDKYVAIVESYATGNVHASLINGSAGGLVGFLLGDVVESYATGNVTGVANAQHLGGLYASGAGDVVDSFATGEVSGWTQSDGTRGQVGGLVGDTTGATSSGKATFTRVYTATAGMAPSSGSDDTSVGGVAGIVQVTYTEWDSVAWNTETAAPFVVNPIGSTPSVTGVSGFLTSQMKDITTFTDPSGLNWNAGGAQTIAAGYDPNYTWGICAAVNNGYPFLTVMYSVNPCASAPTAPQNPVATGGNASATVTWAAPVSDGGSALTGYTVTASPGGQTCVDDTVAPLSCVVTGLTNGISYTFDVTATNGVGTSSAATSNAVTPSDPTPAPTYPPSEPLNVAGVAGDASAVISWSPPASSGSFAVTDYQVVASPGGQTCVAAAPATTCTLTGLTNDESYTVIVRALNGAGWGPWSTPSESFTPVAPVTKAIVITGSRAEVRGRTGVRAFGETTGLEGARLQARVHLAGEIEYYDGSQRTVGADGSFTWQRVTNKKVYVYFRTLDDQVRSNRIVITIR